MSCALITEVWPPEKGSTFDTSVLCWCFQEASFWRGNSVAMAEVVTLARSIAAYRFREAEPSGLNESSFKKVDYLILFLARSSEPTPKILWRGL